MGKSNETQGKAKDPKIKTNPKQNSNQEDVLLNLPGGLKYQLPGKRQRTILGLVVIGLNLVLVLAVIVYFYSPEFQTFVYNFGR
tara:strand:- start:250 stop:501 length:252 start_codon:yes stop_codon:yes gene_type:complete